MYFVYCLVNKECILCIFSLITRELLSGTEGEGHPPSVSNNFFPTKHLNKSKFPLNHRSVFTTMLCYSQDMTTMFIGSMGQKGRTIPIVTHPWMNLNWMKKGLVSKIAEWLTKGPFRIVDVLKFRFCFQIVLTHPPTPNFDFKILMPFPSYPYETFFVVYWVPNALQLY